METRRRAIFLVFLLIFLCTIAAYAQTPQTLPDGVQIIIPESQEALPGQFVTYTFILRNPTLSPARLMLKAWTEHGWSLLGPEEEFILNSQDEVFVPITLMVPASAYGGTVEPLTLSLTQDGKNHRFTINTSIATTHKVTIDGPSMGQATHEADASYAVILYNRGSAPEDINLIARSELGWTVGIQPKSVHLEPGEQKSVLLTHSVPIHALEGAVDSVILSIFYGGSRDDITIKTMVIAGETQTVSDLKIPMRSTFLWDMEIPESLDSSVMRWAYRMNMVQNDYSIDFVADGLYDLESPSTPDILYFTWASPENYLKVGRFDPYWSGVLPTPTQNSAFLWNTKRNNTNLQVIIGTEREEKSFSDEFRWIAFTSSRQDSPWSFRYILPADKSSDLQQMAEVDYAKTFGNKDFNWHLHSRLGVGWGDDDPKRAGDIILQGYSNRWNFRCEYGLTDAFFTGYDRQRFYLSSYYRWNPNLTLENGYSWWETNAWTDPRYNTITHQGVWGRLNFHNTYSLYFGLDQEDNGTDIFIEPKLELRYAQQKDKNYYQFNLIRRYRSYDINEDIQYWTLESRYRHVYSPQHFWDLQADYNIATSTSATDTDIFRFRLGYSAPLSPTWSMTTTVGTSYDKASYDTTDLTFRCELGYRPNTDGQWKLAVSYNDEYASTDHWTIFAYYQGVFTHFFTPPWGSVQGIIFEDVNMNGHYDANDLPIRASLRLDSKESLMTDTSGRGTFTIVRTGPHRLNLDLGDSPYYSLTYDWQINVLRGKQELLEIPVRRKPFLRINLFKDVNQDGRIDINEPALGGVKLSLQQNGKLIGTSISSADGSVFFNNLLPGSYQIEVDKGTLSKDVDHSFPEIKEILVTSEPYTLFEWGFIPYEKPIEFTFDQTEDF